jgi:hypothetical protein
MLLFYTMLCLPSVGIMFSSGWYLCLLQQRAAIYFKTSMPGVGRASHIRPKDKPTTSWYSALLSPSRMLDVLQSWLAPVIVVLLWNFLHVGYYNRGWYFFALAIMQGCCGLRSFYSIVHQRLATLKRIAPIVSNAVQGTNLERNRRRAFLRTKTVTLVLDLLVVFATAFLVPTSVSFFGSSFNSRQFAIHMFVNGTIQLLANSATISHLRSKFRKTKREAMSNDATGVRAGPTFRPTGVPTSNVASSIPEGMSALDASEEYEYK